ncbi:hypothetical protein [Undibacterium umbellatum]|uniref:Uncharacterized protein n=1 Tax=Undibacterium umbellatum TaxID=2762300 RepID=A0ABR6ZIQ3_9BURK|nr:hypothetical protein [Undibacterium umbellatum]MBC3911564.1 hypothetical protein [Undibacterium umbellatum]
MNKSVRFSIAATAFGIAQCAQASNMSGALSIAFGIPVMVVALIIYGTLAAYGKLYYWLLVAAIGLFIPLTLFGILMGKDAWYNIVGVHASTEWGYYSWSYYLLCILIFLCFLKMLKNQNEEN